MEDINKVKFISIWVFLVPFVAVNTCLVLITQFHDLFPNREDVILNTIPYFDGGASISRTARVFPTYWIFKPAMFFTSYLLIKYWLWNRNIINHFENNTKHINKIIFFGIGSAVLLTIHSIFLGVKFDIELYKLFRRLVMLFFIIFEIVAQTLLVITLFKIKNIISDIINKKILILKIILVSILVVTALASLPILTSSGNVQFKHALEWNYFIGVVLFYLLTFFFWKAQKNQKF